MKALTPAQKETRKSAIGFFSNIAAALIVIYTTGMDSFTDWLLLAWCVVCVVGCAWYVQHDIKKSIKEDSDAS